MSAALNCNILTLTIMSILFLSIFGQETKKKHDHLCLPIGTVLCVKDVLSNILTATKTVNEINHEIEQHIFQHRRSVNHTTRLIHSNLLPSIYHDQFMSANNIDQTDIIYLIKEEYYAFSYIYNSIKNLLQINNIWERPIDGKFKTILDILKTNFLCNYRIILNVYSETWLSIDEISGMPILKTRKSPAPSHLHTNYSITITRLLKKWTKNVNDFVVNIENKV